MKDNFWQLTTCHCCLCCIFPSFLSPLKFRGYVLYFGECCVIGKLFPCLNDQAYIAWFTSTRGNIWCKASQNLLFFRTNESPLKHFSNWYIKKRLQCLCCIFPSFLSSKTFLQLIKKSAILINSGLVYCRLLVIILVENLIFYNFILSTAISCWKHQFSSDHWS